MRSFKVTLGLLLSLLATAIVFLGTVSYKYYEESVRTEGLVHHSYEVIDKAEQVASSYKDIQFESNLKFLTGITESAQSYESSKARLLQHVERLRDLTKDGDSQQLRVDSLSSFTGQLIAFTDSVFDFLMPQKAMEQEVVARFRTNSNFRNEIRRLLENIQEHERELLHERKEANAANNQALKNTFVYLFAGIWFLLVAAFLSIRHHFNKRIKAEIELKKAQDDVRKALEAEIELNKMKSNFVSLASHEFRTPLTTILSSAYLVEKSAFNRDQQKFVKHLLRIKSSVNILTSILDEFLSVTRIEEGQVKPSIERLDIRSYLEMTCQNLQTFARPGQSIVYEHRGEEAVNTDPVMLGNIVNNLVTNAIKYSPENSNIRVSSFVNEVLHLSVKDSGIGISDEDQKHLFERFYRGSNAGTAQGTGLGLHIMKHYVDMLNGSIKLKSKLGQGTEVEIVFHRMPG